MAKAETAMAECRRSAALAEPELSQLREKLNAISKREEELRNVRQRKAGLIGTLLGQTEQPEEVTSEISKLQEQSYPLILRKSQLEGLESEIRRWEIRTRSLHSSIAKL